MNPQNNKNLILATSLSVIIMISWTWFYEKPRLEKISLQHQIEQSNQSSKDEKISNKIVEENSNPAIPNVEKLTTEVEKNVSPEEKIDISTSFKTRKEIIEKTTDERIKIESKSLHGSINLKGAKFDDLTLAKYFKNPDKKDEVILFSPIESKERYFADFGFASSDSNLETPKPDTVWQANNKKLTPKNPVTLSWTNSKNIEFQMKISIDENYLFTVQQKIINNSFENIAVAPFARINRLLNDQQKAAYILHEGAIGAFNGILSEKTYEDLIKEKSQKFSDKGESGSWLGITDKYWLSSIIPDRKISFEGNFFHDYKNKNNFYNVDFIGQEIIIASNEQLNLEHHLFAGAKKVKILDDYSKKLELKLFDRAIDFGWFYFLTKPFFFVIEFLYKIFGNFGLAILGMTVIVKLALFPMANKSYSAIAKLKKIQPKIEALREKYKDDKLALNREMMEFYKREKINPAAGCLPILIQIPVFFALYKVFYVTLDMRHSPFYGWIKDLSAPDPTTILNLFGLLPFEISSSFNLGIWPILMGATMVIQQKLSPPPADPTQAKILKFMPYGLTIVLAAFPAGLVIYWTWSNSLSILQQIYINRKYKK
jgi:YidC/Oxa1 family membrane protein insertase